jgi:hypothetical protein
MSQQLPGLQVGRTVAPREILFATQGALQVPIVVDGIRGIDGKNAFTDEIRAGWFMGRINTTGRWVPCKRTSVTPAGGATSSDVPVVNAAAFKIGDVISVGGDAGKTITAVNYATNTITVSGAAFTFANNEPVAAEDGSQTCRGVLVDFVKLRNADDSAPAHQPGGLLIQGAVRVSMLLGDAAAIRADAAAKLAGLRFSDDYGQ